MHTVTKTQWKATRGDISPGSDVLRRLQMRGLANSLYPQKNAVTAFSEDYGFRKASLLDVPFIFHLIVEGSETGAFPVTYSTAKGLPTLFAMLMRDILRPRSTLDNGICDTKTLIFTQGGEDVGFLQTGCMGDKQSHVIKCCAIAQQHRNQHHGSNMIRMYIESLPAVPEVVAYCTKINKAMPRLLKKLGFHKEKANSVYDCYRLKVTEVH